MTVKNTNIWKKFFRILKYFMLLNYFSKKTMNTFILDIDMFCEWLTIYVLLVNILLNMHGPMCMFLDCLFDTPSHFPGTKTKEWIAGCLSSYNIYSGIKIAPSQHRIPRRKNRDETVFLWSSHSLGGPVSVSVVFLTCVLFLAWTLAWRYFVFLMLFSLIWATLRPRSFPWCLYFFIQFDTSASIGLWLLPSEV
jgi:hypothetical protein